MTVRVVIADDEPLARAGLRDLLAAHRWLTVVAEASNGPAAVEAIDRHQPDVAFLDIAMPGLDGIGVLRAVRHQPHVVFTTAHAAHAVTAFELGALDYLLKPFGAERLATALARARAALGAPGAPPAADRLAEALAQGPMTRLFVRSGAALVPVPVAEVRHFEADGDYVIAHAGGARHVLSLSLQKLEGRLDPAAFARLHRAHLVNLAHVKRYLRVDGRLVAELRDGTRVPVSRARAQALRAQGA